MAAPARSLEPQIIYEVNLSVPTPKSDEYLSWLQQFTATMLQIDGFLGVHVFKQPRPEGLHWLSELDADKVYLCVQYEIENREKLNRYLREHQPRVKSEQIDKFGFVVTSRRVLETLFRK